MHSSASDAGGTPVAATEPFGDAGNGVGAGAAGGAGGCDARASRWRRRFSWDFDGSDDVLSAAKTLRSFGTGAAAAGTVSVLGCRAAAVVGRSPAGPAYQTLGPCTPERNCTRGSVTCRTPSMKSHRMRGRSPVSGCAGYKRYDGAPYAPVSSVMPRPASQDPLMRIRRRREGKKCARLMGVRISAVPAGPLMTIVQATVHGGCTDSSEMPDSCR